MDGVDLEQLEKAVLYLFKKIFTTEENRIIIF